MKESLKQNRVKVVIGIICFVIMAFAFKQAFDVTRYGMCNLGNRWIALGSLAGGFCGEAIYTILKDWYDSHYYD